MAKRAPKDNTRRINERLELYRRDFDVDSLNSSNDRAMLMTLIRCEIILENVQDEITDITSAGSDFLEEADKLKKLFDLQRDMMGQITKAQQTLSIDRRTRKTEQTSSVAEYIRELKREATQFLDKRLIRVYCPDCKVLVGRYGPAHDHTAFVVATECSQCHKAVRAHRETNDIWFDVRDADWRRAYQADIVQPRLRTGFHARSTDTVPVADDLIIDATPETPRVAKDEQLDAPDLPALSDGHTLDDGAEN